MLQAVKPFNIQQNKQVNANQNKQQNNKIGFGMQDYEIVDLKEQFQIAADTMQKVGDTLAKSQTGGVDALQNRITTHEQICSTQIVSLDDRMKQFEQRQTRGLQSVTGKVVASVQQQNGKIADLSQSFNQFMQQQTAKTAYTEQKIAQLEKTTQQQDERTADLAKQLERANDCIQVQSSTINETHALLKKLIPITKPQM